MARILVIDESQQRAVEICTGLIKAGHQVAAVLPSALELIARIEEIKPDIILIETESPLRDTLEHLAVMNREMPRPVVMFSQDGERGTIRSAIQAGVAAYVVDGFDVERLSDVVEVAEIHFEEHQALKVGDLVLLGISHPCTTFDKWRWIPVVDDDYTVCDAIVTCF